MGRCTICRFYARLLKDHSHFTGNVRGYICNRCNTVLGNIERGIHKHGTEYFVCDSFVTAIDCYRFHEYLRNSPLERLGMRYR